MKAIIDLKFDFMSYSPAPSIRKSSQQNDPGKKSFFAILSWMTD